MSALILGLFNFHTIPIVKLVLFFVEDTPRFIESSAMSELRACARYVTTIWNDRLACAAASMSRGQVTVASDSSLPEICGFPRLLQDPGLRLV